MRPVLTGTTIRRGIARRVVILVASLALLMLSAGAGVASAAEGSHDGSATFTKWVTAWPSMAGVVGGSVGNGTFAGTVLDYSPGPTTVIDAIYHLAGARHSFTALVHVEQTGLQAVIIGVVTDGWGRGQVVHGHYTQIVCSHDGIRSDCFQGRLQVGRDGG